MNTVTNDAWHRTGMNIMPENIQQATHAIKDAIEKITLTTNISELDVILRNVYKIKNDTCSGATLKVLHFLKESSLLEKLNEDYKSEAQKYAQQKKEFIQTSIRRNEKDELIPTFYDGTVQLEKNNSKGLYIFRNTLIEIFSFGQGKPEDKEQNIGSSPQPISASTSIDEKQLLHELRQQPRMHELPSELLQLTAEIVQNVEQKKILLRETTLIQNNLNKIKSATMADSATQLIILNFLQERGVINTIEERCHNLIISVESSLKKFILTSIEKDNEDNLLPIFTDMSIKIETSTNNFLYYLEDTLIHMFTLGQQIVPDIYKK